MSNAHTPTCERIDNATRLRRLRRAALVVRNTPDSAWDMDTWMDPVHKDGRPQIVYDDRQCRWVSNKSPVCGTVGCALGNCGRDPVLRAEGLECSKYGEFRLYHRKERHALDVATRFFGISLKEAERLFLPGHYARDEYGDIDREQVARRIDRLIAKYERLDD